MADSLLARYVVLHNRAVCSGDFRLLGVLFAEDAVLEFEGIPLGPALGRAGIIAVFTEHPPDDELLVIDEIDGTGAVYAWQADPERAAGTLRITPEHGRIAHLTITAV